MLNDFPEKLSRQNRVEQMAWVAKQYPLPEAPVSLDWPGDPRWYIDARHRDWLQGVLMSGRFRRVLEIGCFHGFSTVAFLEALKAGKVDEVHLCDTTITEQLERVLSRYRKPTHVRVHRCRSVELLAGLKLIFLDIDGVLRPALSDGWGEVGREQAAALNKILASVPDARLVLVSSRRYPLIRGEMTLADLEKSLESAGVRCRGRFHGWLRPEVTGGRHFDLEQWKQHGIQWRGEQIADYLAEHNPKAWVAIDDLALTVERFVKTDSRIGLTEEGAAAAIAAMNTAPCPPFDFAFVDGDHSAETVKEETRLLLQAKTPVVMAHDTSVAPLFPLCDGPQHLKAAFQLAGYRCLEDAILREGEHTERGMFFASRDSHLYQLGLDELRRCTFLQPVKNPR